MKYFPNTNDLNERQLKQLYALRVFSEWDTFMGIIGECRGKISEGLESESVLGNANTVFRDIGALAFTGELVEFMESVGQAVEALYAKGG